MPWNSGVHTLVQAVWLVLPGLAAVRAYGNVGVKAGWVVVVSAFYFATGYAWVMGYEDMDPVKIVCDILFVASPLVAALVLGLGRKQGERRGFDVISPRHG